MLSPNFFSWCFLRSRYSQSSCRLLQSSDRQSRCSVHAWTEDGRAVRAGAVISSPPFRIPAPSHARGSPGWAASAPGGPDLLQYPTLQGCLCRIWRGGRRRWGGKKGILAMGHASACSVGVRRKGPSSFQWRPVTGQGAMGTN